MMYILYHTKTVYGIGVRVIVFSASFKNISALCGQSVLLMETTGVPNEKQIPVTENFITLRCIEYTSS